MKAAELLNILLDEGYSKNKIIYVSKLYRRGMNEDTAEIYIIIRQGISYYFVEVEIGLNIDRNSFEASVIPGTEKILKNKVYKMSRSEIDNLKSYGFKPKKKTPVKYNGEWTNDIMIEVKNVLSKTKKLAGEKSGNMNYSIGRAKKDSENDSSDDFIFGSPMGHVLMNLMK